MENMGTFLMWYDIFLMKNLTESVAGMILDSLILYCVQILEYSDICL